MFKALNYIVSNKGPRYRDINDIRGKVGKGGVERYCSKRFVPMFEKVVG